MSPDFWVRVRTSIIESHLLYNLLFTVTGPTCIPLFETPSNQVCLDLRLVVKHLQILAVNAWTVHIFRPLIQHIPLGSSCKSTRAINVLFTHTVLSVHPASVHHTVRIENPGKK